MSSLGPIPQRLVLPTFFTLRRLHQQGKYRGITLTPPEQQCGSINAAVWGAVLRVSSGAIHDAVGPQPRVRHASAFVDVLVRVFADALHADGHSGHLLDMPDLSMCRHTPRAPCRRGPPISSR